MYLAARTTRALVAHFPEVILLRSHQYTVLGNMLFPKVIRLFVHLKTFLFVTAKHSDVKVLLVNLHHLRQELPAVCYGLFLEIVAKTPVSKHLEHRVVVCVVSHLLKVVVLAAHSQTLLRIAHSLIWRCAVAEKNVLKLIHTGIGEHQCRVILYHHRSRWHNVMVLALKKLEELVAYFV